MSTLGSARRESPEETVDLGPLIGCSRSRGIIFKATLKYTQGWYGLVYLVLVHEEQGVISKRLVLREHPFDQYVVDLVLLRLIEASVLHTEFEDGPQRVLPLNEGTVKVVPQTSPLVASTLRCHSSMMVQTEARWLPALAHKVRTTTAITAADPAAIWDIFRKTHTGPIPRADRLLEDPLCRRPMVPVELYAISYFWPPVATRAVSERAFLSVELPTKTDYGGPTALPHVHVKGNATRWICPGQQGTGSRGSMDSDTVRERVLPGGYV
jgi:hypothetical protein